MQEIFYNYICITDNNDGVNLELWYNDTVRNWVKKIDRLPGSHSDSVIMEWTSFDVPVTPQFITEESNISKGFCYRMGSIPRSNVIRTTTGWRLDICGNRYFFRGKNVGWAVCFPD